MTELSNADDRIHTCDNCGMWVDGAQLNAMLLHANLAGVGSLGGRVLADQATGTCSVCGVDLVRIEQGGRGNSLYYEVCEDCGSVFVPLDPPPPADFEAARTEMLAIFKAFTAKGAGART